jgi:hypothetical protein
MPAYAEALDALWPTRASSGFTGRGSGKLSLGINPAKGAGYANRVHVVK